jgi:hypothetical protein
MTLIGCGKCMACKMGYAPILCERPLETHIHTVPDRRLAGMLVRAARKLGALATIGHKSKRDGSYGVLLVLPLGVTKEAVFDDYHRRHGMTVMTVERRGRTRVSGFAK